MTLQTDVRTDGRPAGRTDERGYHNIPAFSSKIARIKTLTIRTYTNSVGPNQNFSSFIKIHYNNNFNGYESFAQKVTINSILYKHI